MGHGAMAASVAVTVALLDASLQWRLAVVRINNALANGVATAYVFHHPATGEERVSKRLQRPAAGPLKAKYLKHRIRQR